MNQTDFVRLKAKRFQGICPSAYDAQEVIYTFYTIHRTEVMSTCQVAIDLKSPLFNSANSILQQVIESTAQLPMPK